MITLKEKLTKAMWGYKKRMKITAGLWIGEQKALIDKEWFCYKVRQGVIFCSFV